MFSITLKESVEFSSITVGMSCTALVEFSGLWFAKKAFGPSWNIVQLKIHEEKIPEAEVEVEVEGRNISRPIHDPGFRIKKIVDSI